MATTNYHTIDGELIGETTSAIRTDYINDALGSVVGTVNASGSAVNTYRFKPFGTLLAKVGAAQDPRFGWNATFAHCRRGPSTDVTLGNVVWHLTTGLTSGGAKYPLELQVPTLNCQTQSGYPKVMGECGAAHWLVKWLVGKGAPGRRYAIVQQVGYATTLTDCRKCLFPFRCDSLLLQIGCLRLEVWWEAWTFKITSKGDAEFDGPADPSHGKDPLTHDNWKTGEAEDCSEGMQEFAGIAVVFPRSVYNKMGFSRPNRCSSPLLARSTVPPGWSASGGLRRSWKVSHACCCDGKHEIYDHCPPGDVQLTDPSVPKGCQK